MRRFYVYAIFDQLGEPRYIGKGYGYRLSTHRTNSHNKRLQRLFDDAKGELPVVVIRDDLSEEDAFDLECRLIAVIGRKDMGRGPLFNRTDGGDGSSGSIRSRAAIESHRAKMIGRVVSEETRRRIGEAHKGRQFSPEHRQKLRRPFPPEHREKLRQAKLGRKQSPSHVANRFKNAKGRKRPPEVIAKIKEGQRRAWKRGRKPGGRKKKA